MAPGHFYMVQYLVPTAPTRIFGVDTSYRHTKSHKTGGRIWSKNPKKNVVVEDSLRVVPNRTHALQVSQASHGFDPEKIFFFFMTHHWQRIPQVSILINHFCFARITISQISQIDSAWKFHSNSWNKNCVTKWLWHILHILGVQI